MTDGLVLVASPTSRLSSAQRGAECRLPVFHAENSAIIKQHTGYYSPEIFPSTGKDCNPQPANCLKIYTSYAIAAWMIGRQNGLFRKISCFKRMDTETASLFHCKPCYSKMTFTIITRWLTVFSILLVIGLITINKVIT
ncbi:hypothetical protein ACLK19_07490 [Escherichia coli]